MSIETSRKYVDQPVQNLIIDAVQPWFDIGRWENEHKANIHRGLRAIAGFTRESVFFAQNSRNENRTVAATMGGSLSQMASGALPPDFRMQTLQKILQLDTTNTTTLIQQAIEDVASKDLDLDIYLHTYQLEVSAIKNWFAKEHPTSKQQPHIWVDPEDPTFYIDCVYVKLPNKAQILTFQLFHGKEKIFHADITKAAENIKNEKRTLSGGKQDNQAYPVNATDEDLIIRPSRRVQLDPEIAIPLYSDNTPESLLLLTARELLKSLNPLIAKKEIVPSELSDLVENEYFVDRVSLAKINQEMTREQYDLLDDEVKKMWLLDVILIATLDPFVAYWYLNVINGVPFVSDMEDNPDMDTMFARFTTQLQCDNSDAARTKYIQGTTDVRGAELLLTSLLAPQPQT